MSNPVVIKANKYGIMVVLDKDIEFGELKEKFLEKFKSSANFFKEADMAISFEGRELSPEEQSELLDIISENTGLNVICVIDNDEDKERNFRMAVEKELAKRAMNTGEFYKGTLRSGQSVESQSGLIILGDVNAGANVTAAGNVIILGSLKGTVYAGTGGNGGAFVAALEMAPIQIRIGDVIARSEDSKPVAKKKKNEKSEPMLAYVENGNIYMEKLSKESVNDIKL